MSFYDGAAAEAREKAVMRRSRGHAAKRAGSQLETWLTNAHTWYKVDGRACVAKLEPRVKGSMHTDRGLFYAGKNDYDYGGWFTRGPGQPAQPIAFDAKHTDDASLALPSDPKNYKTMVHQITSLLDFAKGPGAVACMLFVDDALGYGWFVFPPELQRVLAGQRVTLRRKESGGIVHHVPSFLLSNTEAMAKGAPFVDWHRGLVRTLAAHDAPPMR